MIKCSLPILQLLSELENAWRLFDFSSSTSVDFLADKSLHDQLANASRVCGITISVYGDSRYGQDLIARCPEFNGYFARLTELVRCTVIAYREALTAGVDCRLETLSE
jgi:hypothetical protein